VETCQWSTTHHLDPPDLSWHGCYSDWGPAASGGQTVLANKRNGGRIRLIASRHFYYYYTWLQTVTYRGTTGPGMAYFYWSRFKTSASLVHHATYELHSYYYSSEHNRCNQLTAVESHISVTKAAHFFLHISSSIVLYKVTKADRWQNCAYIKWLHFETKCIRIYALISNSNSPFLWLQPVKAKSPSPASCHCFGLLETSLTWSKDIVLTPSLPFWWVTSSCAIW